MFGRVERRGGARFVVVFQESHEAVLIIEAGEEVLAHRAGVAVAQSVKGIRQSNAPSGSGVFLMQCRDDGNCRGWRREAAKPPRN